MSTSDQWTWLNSLTDWGHLNFHQRILTWSLSHISDNYLLYERTHLLCHFLHVFLIPLPSFSSVQSLSRVQLFATPWIAACQASPSITNSRSSPKLMSIESVMPSSHLILCRPLLLLPPIPSSIRVFYNESALRIRWPKYWPSSPSASILPMNTQDWSPLG